LHPFGRTGQGRLLGSFLFSQRWFGFFFFSNILNPLDRYLGRLVRFLLIEILGFLNVGLWCRLLL
jgi:hypothetical protein